MLTLAAQGRDLPLGDIGEGGHAGGVSNQSMPTPPVDTHAQENRVDRRCEHDTHCPLARGRQRFPLPRAFRRSVTIPPMPSCPARRPLVFTCVALVACLLTGCTKFQLLDA